MDLLKETKEICSQNNIRPARSRGQNFLIEESVYTDVIEAANLNSDDVVLEIGPGLGFLTFRLAEAAQRVIAVELDQALARVLSARLLELGIKNVEVVNANILDIRLNCGADKQLKFILGEQSLKIPNAEYKIVANLPYNITSIFLRKFLEMEFKPLELVLMLQKEVAERITAEPGSMSILAVSVQYYAEAEIVSKNIVKESFWPVPEVNSAIIRIKTRKQKFDPKADKDFFRLVKIGFAQKRKMLKNNLMNGFRLKADKVDEILLNVGLAKTVRAQELGVADWKNILKVLQ